MHLSGYPPGVWMKFFFVQVIASCTGNRNIDLKTNLQKSGRGRVHSLFNRRLSGSEDLPVIPGSFSFVRKAFLTTLFILAFLFPELNGQWLDGYCYRKQITIPASSVTGGPHTNFPVLIDISDPDLISAFNGGLVQSDDGFDIVFTQDDQITQLNHEMESYDPVSGNYIAWVQVPTLNSVSDNTLYLYFGNSSITTDPSTANTWDPNAYVAVYHLGDDFADATGMHPDAINSGSSDIVAFIADGQEFQESDDTDVIELGGLDIPNNELTISAWIFPNNLTLPDARIVSKANGTLLDNHWWMLSTMNHTDLRFRLKTDGFSEVYEPPNNVLSDGSWQFVSAIWNGNRMYIYHNASSVGAGQNKSGNIDTDPSINAAIGNQPSPTIYGERSFDGIIDEVRIQKVARSSGWLQTEYDNQMDPSSFISPGSSEKDTEAPILEGVFPADETNLNLCFGDLPGGPTEAEIAALYSDNSGTVNVTKSGTPAGNDCNWSVSYTYTIEDNCGNEVTPSPTVSYTGGDTEAPTLTGTLPGGAVGNVCIDDAPVAPDESAIASQYTDNCGVVTATLIDSEVTGDDCSWTATYTYTVEDECNNFAANAVVVYTGGDTEAPTLTGTLPGGAQGNVCIADVPVAPTEGTIASQYTDNCGTVTALSLIHI